MLAQIVRANTPSSVTPAIAIADGRISSYTPEIIGRFKEYYEELYSSR